MKSIAGAFDTWNKAKQHIGLKTTSSTSKISDSNLLDGLRHVADKLEVSQITIAQYSSKGKYSEATIRQRFGSWRRALSEAGLGTKQTSPRNKHSDKALLDGILLVAKIVHRNTVTQGQYRENCSGSMASTETIKRRFGKWNEALKRAGLETNSPGGYASHTAEDAARALAGVMMKVRDAPTQAQYANQKSVDAPNANSVIRLLKAKKWKDAIERANEFIRTGSVPSSGSSTPRKPNDTLKDKIWKRAKGKCETPGCPSEHPRIPRNLFHYDHIVPWEKGGETVLENMQLLCRACNLAKGSR